MHEIIRDADTAEEALERLAGSGSGVRSRRGVAGGCIANGSRFELTDGSSWFVKRSSSLPAGMFRAEADGLAALGAGPGPRVPRVAAVGDGFIVMEWIESGRKQAGFHEAFGRELAQLHRRTDCDRYGFHADNYIGSTPQPNSWTDSWFEFFRVHRLGYQSRLAYDRGLIDDALLREIESVGARLESLLPRPEHPALLHGDLWGGNYMADSAGEPVLIDPASYYGHREADLAMTRLFGGFGEGFYRGYESAWPTEPGFDERVPLYNLYHVLNHANIFGGSYVSSARSIVRRYR